MPVNIVVIPSKAAILNIHNLQYTVKNTVLNTGIPLKNPYIPEICRVSSSLYRHGNLRSTAILKIQNLQLTVMNTVLNTGIPIKTLYTGKYTGI